MKIGELSQRTGVATRLLRYYEQQDLLSSSRSGNGYRAYDDAAVDRVLQIKGLLMSGLPTRLIKILLDMEGVRGTELAADCTRTVATLISRDLAAIESRIQCLQQSRRTMRQWLSTAGFESRDLVGAEGRL